MSLLDFRALAEQLISRGRGLARRVVPVRYRRGNPFHSRGLARFDAKLAAIGAPDLCAQVEDHLRAHGGCKLLEIGCGEGRLLLDLLARFGRRVELHGLNDPAWAVVRTGRDLVRTNDELHVLAPALLRSLPLPSLHLADAQDLALFPDGSFDLVVSQGVLQHVPDKARALEESARLLAPGGAFLHDLDRLDLPAVDFLDADLPRFTVYAAGARVSTTAYLRARGLDVRLGVGPRKTFAFARYQATRPSLRLGLTLDPASTLRLASIAAYDRSIRLWGARSVYRAQLPAKGA